MRKFEEKMFHLIVMLAMPGALVKTTSATDLTSDFTSTVDDQYPWSALAQRKGPTVQDTLQWKLTATDRSEKGAIDRFLESAWNKSPRMPDKHYSRSSSGQKIEDQGPGSIEIYRLTNLDASELNSIPLPPWNNPTSHKNLMKNKSPKVIYQEPKKSHNQGLKKPILPVRETQMTHKERKDGDSQGVPELQIGCEGLEAPIEPSSREPRSISVKNESSQEYSYTDSEVPPVPVNPVTIDWDYNEDNQPRHYEDMDELLKLKKLERHLNKKIQHRGDMRPEQDSDLEFDLKKAPVRGDLASRKVRSILAEPVASKASWGSSGPWGFGENDGYISKEDDDDDDDDDDESKTRHSTEAERHRQVYQRAQHEELERRRLEQLGRIERQRVEASRRSDNQINSQIEGIRKEYELRLSAEQRDQERKLKDYIERNRPIVVENREDKDRRAFEEFRRRLEENRRNPGVRQRDHSRGPSPPITYPSLSRSSVDRDDIRRRDDEARRREEEYQRRKEEESRRMDEYRRQLEQREQHQYVNNQTRHEPRVMLEERQRAEERREDGRRRELERRREESIRLEEERRRSEVNDRIREEKRRRDEDRLHRIMALKQKVPGVMRLDQVERKRWNEMRLNALPVSARIILVPNLSTRSSTSSPLFPSRGNFDDDDDDVNLTGINPNRPGLNAGRFPAPRTPKPPSNPPGACVWAVVQCCPTGDQRRLNSCFEYLGCPGVNWDPNPCRGELFDAARSKVAQYYASADQP